MVGGHNESTTAFPIQDVLCDIQSNDGSVEMTIAIKVHKKLQSWCMYLWLAAGVMTFIAGLSFLLPAGPTQ